MEMEDRCVSSNIVVDVFATARFVLSVSRSVGRLVAHYLTLELPLCLGELEGELWKRKSKHLRRDASRLAECHDKIAAAVVIAVGRTSQCWTFRV